MTTMKTKSFIHVPLGEDHLLIRKQILLRNLTREITCCQRKVKTKILNPPFLCVGGKAAIIKVIDLIRNSPVALLRGHGNDINDLKISPTNESLLLSAAKDESCRLWNLETFSCVCIFGGQNGHRKEVVLSLSWHPLGREFASSGGDKSIRLWSIADQIVSEAIQASGRISNSQISDKTSFRPYCSQFPYFATTKVHLNVVDCVQWIGDMILSKSTNNSIVLWMPDLSDDSKVKSAAFTPPSDIIPLRYVFLLFARNKNCQIDNMHLSPEYKRTFKIDHCDKKMYLRFATDLMGRYLAIGNLLGGVKLWSIDDYDDEEPCQTLDPIVESPIRMLSFAPDGKILIGCTDDGKICRWDYHH